MSVPAWKAGTEFKAIRAVTGALINLTTTEKGSLVGAINEIKAILLKPPNFAGQTSNMGMGGRGPQGTLQRTSTLDGLNVDFDSILGSLNGGGNPEDFDIFSTMGSSNGVQDNSAIFVPVDSGVQSGGDFGTTSPNGGLQQWVSCNVCTSLC